MLHVGLSIPAMRSHLFVCVSCYSGGDLSTTVADVLLMLVAFT